MKVAVVVLNWNQEHYTVPCVESLLAQRNADVDIILVDNGSADESGARLHARFPELAYVQTGDNIGYAGGNNAGIACALERGAEAVLVINNDTVADEWCVSRLVDALEQHPEVAAVSALITRFDDPSRVWFAGGSISVERVMCTHDDYNASVDLVVSRLADPEAVQLCTFLCGCCMMIRADVLREVGLFKADYFIYVEDTELSYRLGLAGWKLGWVPMARLAHKVPALDVQETPRQIYLRDRNRRRMARSHLSVLQRLVFAGWFWPTRFVHFARYVAKGDWSRARALVTGAFHR